jgi:hypothetical protein
VNDTNLAKLAILDAYIALLDAQVYCARVKGLVRLGVLLEPIAHDLNEFMLAMYDEPFKTALKRTANKGLSVPMGLKRKRVKRGLKRV